MLANEPTWIILPQGLMPFIVEDRPHPAGMGGHQLVLRFPNNYGASVVPFRYSYGADEGLYELAVIVFRADDDFVLTYGTPITNDVIGYLTARNVAGICNRIRKLDAAPPGTAERIAQERAELRREMMAKVESR